MTGLKVLDRIRKIVAKAEGTNNVAEAEMLMSKVHQMLEEHDMEMLDVESFSDDPVGTDKHALHCWTSNSWMKVLSNTLALYYGCKMVQTSSKNKTYFTVHGRESARVTWKLMVSFIQAQVRAEARVLQKELGYSKPKSERHIANALSSRIHRLVLQQRSREDERRVSNGRALIPIDLAEAEMNSFWGDDLGKTRRFKSVTSRAAREAAEKISLHRQTNGGSSLKLELR